MCLRLSCGTLHFAARLCTNACVVVWCGKMVQIFGCDGVCAERKKALDVAPMSLLLLGRLSLCQLCTVQKFASCKLADLSCVEPLLLFQEICDVCPHLEARLLAGLMLGEVSVALDPCAYSAQCDHLDLRSTIPWSATLSVC